MGEGEQTEKMTGGRKYQQINVDWQQALLRALVTCGGYLLPECGPLFGLCPPLRLEAADCVSWAVLASCQPLLGCRLVSVNPRWDAANRCVG